ncbi:hypothetical protein Theam_1770 (plasmid) [Thermovibrio ammonificans HB-1]|uniref:Uncharacterized protein n=1 Tax=Thermovibrio ammonificans (strain DSM 15698 / JCM 12110 / HB-1) TaxID=648996 RepID=E8T705_THEA1|nr:hypothetical protein [Thermovibrio ammonificans]ADU97726.1 hypothetical protein Theam_1770 [Thermovibrio ammonificans HB-1]
MLRAKPSIVSAVFVATVITATIYAGLIYVNIKKTAKAEKILQHQKFIEMKFKKYGPKLEEKAVNALCNCIQSKTLADAKMCLIKTEADYLYEALPNLVQSIEDACINFIQEQDKSIDYDSAQSACEIIARRYGDKLQSKLKRELEQAFSECYQRKLESN